MQSPSLIGPKVFRGELRNLLNDDRYRLADGFGVAAQRRHGWIGFACLKSREISSRNAGTFFQFSQRDTGRFSDWTNRRIKVTSPKSEHYEGKESRLIPFFPESQAVLEEGKVNAGDSPFVIVRYREATQNLGTTFRKIVKRAGLKLWPKLFQNLRSTRQTELCEEFPSHAVCEWIGNSERVAKEHYLQLTDAHFEKASQVTSEKVVATIVATKAPERRRKGPLLKRSVNEKSREIRGHSSGYVVVPLSKMGAEGAKLRRRNGRKHWGKWCFDEWSASVRCKRAADDGGTERKRG